MQAHAGGGSSRALIYSGLASHLRFRIKVRWVSSLLS